MARQGLMDDAGYDFFDVSDCSNYESCREDAYNDGYEKGRADGYSQAENDYHKQTEKDRQSSYDCGYEQGRADELDKIDKMILLGCEELKCDECDYRLYSQDVCQQAYTIGVIENYIAKQLKEQK